MSKPKRWWMEMFQRATGAEVPHPPAVCASLFHCTVHPKPQLGPAHICSTWLLSRSIFNHRGRVAAATLPPMPWDTQRQAYLTLCIVLMDCMLEDTKETAVSWLCLIDSSNGCTLTLNHDSIEKDVRSSSVLFSNRFPPTCDVHIIMLALLCLIDYNSSCLMMYAWCLCAHWCAVICSGGEWHIIWHSV